MDACVQAFEHAWAGQELAPDSLAQATLPQHYGGLGLPLLDNVADAAYIASREQARPLAAVLWVEDASMDGGPGTAAGDAYLRDANHRFGLASHAAPNVAMQVDGSEEYDEPGLHDRTQKALANKVAVTVFRHLWNRAGPADKARLQAVSAPGTAAWLQAPPPTGGTLFSEQQFGVTVAMRLGATVDGTRPKPCRFCGAARDAKGCHDMSCTYGGDTTLRHNDVRDIIFRLAKKARTNPELERAGLLNEPGLCLELRRPADVLVRLARTEEGDPHTGGGTAGPVEAVAVDVKVINHCGREHSHTTDEPDPPRDNGAVCGQGRPS